MHPLSGEETMAKRPVNIQFKVNNPKKDTGRFAFILVVSVLLVLSVSLLIIFASNGFNINGAFGIDAQTETETQTEETQIKAEGSKTYVFWCADDDDLKFLWIAKFELPERKVSVCALDTDSELTVASDSENNYKKSETIAQIFAKYGKKELINYIEKNFGIKADGYVGSTPEQFKVMINYFGGIDVTVNEQIEYRDSDMALVLVKGNQNLKGDSFYKYICYLGKLGENGMQQQAVALNEVLSDVFVPSNANRGTNIFSKISNTLDTNLTIVDFSCVEDSAAYFAENGIAVKNICKTPDEMK